MDSVVSLVSHPLGRDVEANQSDSEYQQIRPLRLSRTRNRALPLRDTNYRDGSAKALVCSSVLSQAGGKDRDANVTLVVIRFTELPLPSLAV